MTIYSEIIGNTADKDWQQRASQADIEYLVLDQWTAQKSRFVALSTLGREYAVALKRNTRLHDGDILAYDASQHRMLVIGLDLGQVMVVDCGKLQPLPPEQIIHTAVELGHAIGNQHWPAVTKGWRIYVPLTVDKKVMRSVMQTHNIPHTEVSFLSADEVIPFLAPHEIRALFGGAEQTEHHNSHSHTHQHNNQYHNQHHNHSHDEHR